MQSGGSFVGGGLKSSFQDKSGASYFGNSRGVSPMRAQNANNFTNPRSSLDNLEYSVNTKTSQEFRSLNQDALDFDLEKIQPQYQNQIPVRSYKQSPQAN